jgi:hypothetical protein
MEERIQAASKRFLRAARRGRLRADRFRSIEARRRAPTVIRPVNLVRWRQIVLVVFLAAPRWATAGEKDAKPIALHHDNPHYFLFRGKPAFLLTSGEHYGAVLNKEFNYAVYLDELRARGFNLTRTFSGTYREIPGSFNIVENTLAPKPESYVCPWARSGTPGAGDGLDKFDLKKFDPAYFERLKDFVGQAGRRGIVVELVLFCTIYKDELWAVNPMKLGNNVQNFGNVDRQAVYTLESKQLTEVQEALVRKIVTELKDFDNLYYEVCNEPYFGGVTQAWTDRMVEVIRDAEKDLPTKHLVAQNIANGAKKIDKPNPGVSIFNFHYATPPDTVKQNYDLKKALADDETGFRGKADLPYRTEAWDFLLAGGAVYSNLDYSFTVKQPGGTAVVTTSPGGGGPELRRQLQVLGDFLAGFDFVNMKPNNAVLKGGIVKSVSLTGGDQPEARVTARALVEPGKAYAIYIRGGSQIDLAVDLPAGSYRAEWVNTKSGKIEKKEDVKPLGRDSILTSPKYADDIALRIVRVPKK